MFPLPHYILRGARQTESDAPRRAPACARQTPATRSAAAAFPAPASPLPVPVPEVRSCCAAFLAVASLLLVPAPARASLVELFGASSRSQGMGSTGVAGARDFSALYYNPALLARAPDTFSVEYEQAYVDLSVLLMDRPAGYDPPYYDYRLNPRDDFNPDPSLWAVTVGATFDFGTDFLSAGFLALIPSAGVGNQEAHFSNETEQYFSNTVHMELLGPRVQTQTIIMGFAMNATHWLSVGVGFVFDTVSNSSNEIYTPNAADPTTVEMNLKVAQDSDLALVAGVHADLGKGFSAGLTARDEHFFALTGSNIIQIHGLEGKDDYLLEQPMDFTLHYSPRTFAAGLAYSNDMLAVELDASYVQWSRYIDARRNPAGFTDSFDLSLGVEYEILGADTRVGVRYTPSPVPEQVGRTNFADNDRIALTTGVGGTLNILGADLGVDIHFQAILLPEQTSTKEVLDSYPECADGVSSLCDEAPDLPGLQTGNPGFPGFSSGGVILSAGVTATWQFGE